MRVEVVVVTKIFHALYLPTYLPRYCPQQHHHPEELVHASTLQLLVRQAGELIISRNGFTGRICLLSFLGEMPGRRAVHLVSLSSLVYISPSTGDLLTNKTRPWKAVLSAITSNEVDEYDKSSALAQFLYDPEVAHLLSQPFDAFPPPSPETKTRFEQKTSAINVTPSPNSRFDLKVIKEDTLWLSQAVDVDEVSALRIVVVEAQNRTAAQLLGQFSEEELAGIREAAGNSKYSSAIPMSLLSQGADPELVRSAFASQDSRRQRILHTYLVERRCLLKSIETLLQLVRDCSSQDQDSTRDKSPEVSKPWLQTKASEILQKFGPRNVFLTRAFSAIKAIAIKSESGSGCFAQNGGNNEIEVAWTTSHLSEMIHVMEIVFDLLASNPEITSANVIDQWLHLIQDCGFFESLSLVGICVNLWYLIY